MIRKMTGRILSVVIILAMLVCILPVQAMSAGFGEKVRVGACPEFGISKTGSVYSGFAYDYLMEVQAYTGHRYTFIEATPAELVEMLDEGTIDILPCVTAAEYKHWSEIYFNSLERSADRASTPILSSSSMMKKFTAIYVSDNDPDSISYNDTESLNQATIGYMEDCKGKYFVDDTFIRGDIDDATFVAYSTEAQMKADFEEGVIDAVIKECFFPWEDESIIYQYDTKDCYFLTSGEDEGLAAQLDIAVNSITMKNSNIPHDLYHKHIEKYGVPKYALSEAEKRYVKEHPVLRMAYNTQSGILEKYDSTTGQVVGITGDALNDLEKMTGLDIQVHPCNSLEECVKLLADGEADAICGGVNALSMSRFGNFRISSVYSSAPVVMVGKSNAVLQSNPRIAIPYYGDTTNEYITHNFSKATTMMCSDSKGCMEAVAAGEADLACMSAYEALYLINAYYSDMYILGVTAINHSECLAYAEDVDSQLVSLIGKGISRLNGSGSMTSHYNSLAAAGGITLVNAVPVQVVHIILGVIAFLVIVVLVIFIAIRRRNKIDSEVDMLTGGRNKQKFIEDIKKMMKRSSPEKWALVMFDIDKFKFVNDRLGYEEGDRMLERIYKTISDNMDENEIFARISDDNFACVVRNGPDNEITMRFSNIYAEFERRNSLFVKYPVIFSAGVCRLGQCLEGGKEIDVNAALDRCIIAKKTMKSSHFSSIAFYDGKIRDKVLREKDYENLMPIALEQREFECYLQPKYGLKSRHIEGAEALIRWNSKEFGFVFPNEFIPISEKNGFVVELDFFILEEVCRAMRRWLDDGKTPVVVSVNQSRLHLNYDDYIWRLREIVDKYEIPYEYIELELTESVFMENADRLLEIMHKLHDIGFKLSLDDFGSGYSSLNMLKDIPVDVVKIDREFFNGTVNSEKGRAVISTVVDLASNLNMEVISEGVETLEQVEFLTEINCAMVQGYYFAKPMTMQQFEELWNKDIELMQAEQLQQTLE